MNFQALYLHIPFCIKKCNYCDFVSYAVKDYKKEGEEYLHLLFKEAVYWHQTADLSGLESVYFGGGTPTVMTGLPDFIIDLRKLLNIKLDTEITVECNPGTIDINGLCALKEAGVNRLSIGVESLDDSELKNMGRIHSAAIAKETLASAKKAGFDNINIDLIYGLPGQTLAGWQGTLAKSLLLETQHISFYGLTLSEKTPWGRALEAGELTLPDDDVTADMMVWGEAVLIANGFSHYEIANFARPGFESRHNLAYWQRKNYLGLGIAASSFCDNRRFTNLKDFKAYRDAIQYGRNAISNEEILSERDVLSEAMFLGLRLLDGIDLSQLYERYGVRAEKYFVIEIDKLTGYGLLKTDDNKLKLTEKGLLLANEVFMEFLP